MAQAALEIGKAYTLTPAQLVALAGTTSTMAAFSTTAAKLPTGMTIARSSLAGTPTAFAGGEYVRLVDGHGNPGLVIYLVPVAVEVTPAPPVFTDPPGVQLPEVEGVVYMVTGEPAPGVEVVVTAAPAPGYAFPAEAVTSWAHTFDALPEPYPNAQAVAAFTGQGEDAAVVALAGEHLPVITAMARAYTRGNGFTAGQPNDEIGAVIVAATARLMANPEQLRYRVGDVSYQSAFQGWTLAEQAVLNRYRKRAA